MDEVTDTTTSTLNGAAHQAPKTKKPRAAAEQPGDHGGDIVGDYRRAEERAIARLKAIETERAELRDMLHIDSTQTHVFADGSVSQPTELPAQLTIGRDANLSLAEGVKVHGIGKAKRATAKTSSKKPTRAPAKASAPKAERAPRRSPEDIAQQVKHVVAALKKFPEGMRAEELKALLDLQAKDMPRILKAALESKQVKRTGEKRATTYSFVDDGEE